MIPVVIFCLPQLPAKFGTVAQGGEGGWHVPYSNTISRLPFEVPNTWLCLQPPHSKISSGNLTMTEPLEAITTTTATRISSKSYHKQTMIADTNNESGDKTDSVYLKSHPSVETRLSRNNTPLVKENQTRQRSHKSKIQRKVLINDVFE